MDGKIKRLKNAVMRSYSIVTINADINDTNFHYTECGIAKLSEESSKQNFWYLSAI